MPSFYVHERAALMLTGTACAQAVALGSLGPDALYCGAGALRELGRRLHRERTGEFLGLLAQCCADDAQCRDYALGFLSHYAVDAAFHPLVYALSASSGGYGPLRHLAVERALDAWIRDMGGFARSPAPDAALPGRAARRLSRALGLWTGGSAPAAGELEQAFRRCLSVGSVLGALGEVSTGVRAEGGVQLSPSQIQAFAQKGWRDPATNALRCEGPFDLLASALDTGERLAAAARGYWQGCITRAELEAATGNLSYLSGADCRRAL